jgi:hypothetical protein
MVAFERCLMLMNIHPNTFFKASNGLTHHSTPSIF